MELFGGAYTAVIQLWKQRDNAGGGGGRYFDDPLTGNRYALTDERRIVNINAGDLLGIAVDELYHVDSAVGTRIVALLGQDGEEWDNLVSALEYVSVTQVVPLAVGPVGVAGPAGFADFAGLEVGASPTTVGHQYVTAWTELDPVTGFYRIVGTGSTTDGACLPEELIRGLQGTSLLKAYGGSGGGSRTKLKLTVDLLRQVCKVPAPRRFRYRDLQPFLAFHSLALVVVDITGAVRLKWDFTATAPKARTGTSTVHLLHHNRHVTLFDVDRQSFSKLPGRWFRDPDDAAAVAKHLAVDPDYTPPKETERLAALRTWADVEDLWRRASAVREDLVVKGYAGQWRYTWAVPGSTLHDLWTYLQTEHGYEPAVTFYRDNVRALRIKLCRDATPAERVAAGLPADRGKTLVFRVGIRIYAEDTYDGAEAETFNAVRDRWVQTVFYRAGGISPRTVLNANTAIVFSEHYARGQLRRVARELPPDATVYALDAVRLFTGILYRLPRIPVFASSDQFERYEPGAHIRDWSLYLVAYPPAAAAGAPAWKRFQTFLLADKPRVAMWGRNVKAARAAAAVDLLPHIVAVCHPAHHVASYFKPLIDQLYTIDDAALHKLVPNIFVGISGKRGRTATLSHYTSDVREALDLSAYYRAHGGNRTKVLAPAAMLTVDGGQGYIAVCESTMTTFRSGFFPIQSMVHDCARLEMAAGIQRLYEALHCDDALMDAIFVGVRADALLVAKDPSDALFAASPVWTVHSVAPTVTVANLAAVEWKIERDAEGAVARKPPPRTVLTQLAEGDAVSRPDARTLPAAGGEVVVHVAPALEPFHASSAPVDPAVDVPEEVFTGIPSLPAVSVGYRQPLPHILSAVMLPAPHGVSIYELPGNVLVTGVAGGGKTTECLSGAPAVIGAVTIVCPTHERRKDCEARCVWEVDGVPGRHTHATRTVSKVLHDERRHEKNPAIPTWAPREGDTVILEEAAFLPDAELADFLAFMDNHPAAKYIINLDFLQNTIDSGAGAGRKARWMGELAKRCHWHRHLDVNYRLRNPSHREAHARLRAAWEAKQDAIGVSGAPIADPREDLYAILQDDRWRDTTFVFARTTEELTAAGVERFITPDNAAAFVWNDHLTWGCSAPGLPVIFRGESNRVKEGLINHRQYAVLEADNGATPKTFTLEVEVTAKDGGVTTERRAFPQSLFRPAYGMTCHLAQGQAFAGVHGVDIASPVWKPAAPSPTVIPYLYTSTTRAEDLQEARLYTGPPMGGKLLWYVAQAVAATAEPPHRFTYTDAVSLLKKQNGCCGVCAGRLGVCAGRVADEPEARLVLARKELGAPLRTGGQKKHLNAQWVHVGCSDDEQLAAAQPAALWTAAHQQDDAAGVAVDDEEDAPAAAPAEEPVDADVDHGYIEFDDGWHTWAGEAWEYKAQPSGAPKRRRRRQR